MRILITSLAICTSLVIAACSSGDSGPPTATVENSPTPTAEHSSPPEPERDFIADILARIPDSEDNRTWLFVADFALASELGGIEAPTVLTEESFLAYLRAMEGFESNIYVAFPGWISGYGSYATEFFEFREVLGYNLTKVNAGVFTGFYDEFYEVAAVDYDPADTVSRINACADCPQPEEMEYEGVAFHRWDNDPDATDLRSRFSPPLMDNDGLGGNVWFDDEFIHRTSTTNDMQGVIGATGDTVPSLLDNDVVAMLHVAMRDASSYSYMLSEQPVYLESAVPWDLEATEEEIDRLLAEYRPLRDYHAYAVGSAMEDGKPFIALTVFCESEGDAAHNAEQLRHNLGTERFLSDDEPFSDFFTGFEVSVEGEVVVARLFNEDSPQSWAKMLNNNLFPQLIGTE